MQPTRPFARVRVPHGCGHSTLHSRAQRKRPPSAHGCEWLRCGCGSEHTHRTAHHAARHTVRRGTHRVLVAPRAATLSAPSHCACRTAAGRERPQAQHHAAARGAAGGPVPCYVQYPAVPYRVSATVLGAPSGSSTLARQHSKHALQRAWLPSACSCLRASVRACVRACMRAPVRVCVRARVRA